jgi:hypothetical protein
VKGRDALQLLVELDRGVTAGEVAAEARRRGMLWPSADGRIAAPLLRALCRSDLARERHGAPRSYQPTDRGRAVDAVLAAVTVARGGEFMPLNRTDLTMDELRAIQR